METTTRNERPRVYRTLTLDACVRYSARVYYSQALNIRRIATMQLARKIYRLIREERGQALADTFVVPVLGMIVVTGSCALGLTLITSL